MQLLAARERDLDLRPALLVEINLERHDRHALPLGPLRNTRDLARLQKELARPLRLMAETARLRILGDICIDKENLTALLDRRVALADIGLAAAQGLHLRAREHEPGLKNLANLIIVARPPVFGGDPARALRFFRRFRGGEHRQPDLIRNLAEYREAVFRARRIRIDEHGRMERREQVLYLERRGKIARKAGLMHLRALPRRNIGGHRDTAMPAMRHDGKRRHVLAG